MPSFGKHSRECLDTCHPDIVRVLERAIQEYDFSVIEGHRTKEKQDEYFKSGASKVRYPGSYHNSLPSLAVDIVPYPIDWTDLHRFKELADIVKKCADKEGVKLDWGYDLWKWDMPHYQLRQEDGE